MMVSVQDTRLLKPYAHHGKVIAEHIHTHSSHENRIQAQHNKPQEQNQAHTHVGIGPSIMQ